MKHWIRRALRNNMTIESIGLDPSYDPQAREALQPQSWHRGHTLVLPDLDAVGSVRFRLRRNGSGQQRLIVETKNICGRWVSL